MATPRDQTTSAAGRGEEQASSLRPGRVAIIVGGAIDPSMRDGIREGVSPRIDILEMQSTYGAPIWEFSHFGGAHVGARLLRWLAARIGGWSELLACTVLTRVRNYDLIYATGEDVGLPLAALMRAFRIDRPRLVVRLEDPIRGRSSLRQFLFNAMMRFALKRVDKTLPRTTAHLQYLHSIFRVPESQLALALQPVDSAFYSSASVVPSGTILEAPEETYIVGAGMEMRDYAVLIEAVRGLPVKLIIAAGSPWSQERLVRENTASLPSNVTVASYSVLETRELYRTAAFVVLPLFPTLRACGASVVLEAWAMRKAVIATRTTGMLDYLVDDETALLVEPGNALAMRSKIAYLLDHREVAVRLGRAGRQVVEQRLSQALYLQFLHREFVGLLDASGTGER